MAYDSTRVTNHIIDVLNATTAGWGGALDDAKRSDGAIENARIQSGWEIIRAISANPQSGYYGPLAVPITVAHNAFLPGHDGEIGIPQIVPFTDAVAMGGIPATADQIDSWRFTAANKLYSAGLDGAAIAHDAADDDGFPSPIACRYSLVNGQFKFTGKTAQIPMIVITRAMADTGVPEAFEPTQVKLSIAKLVKEGDNLAQLAGAYDQLGQRDLELIRSGAMNVSPVPMIEFAQKTGEV